MNRLLIAGSRSYEGQPLAWASPIFDNASYVFDVPFDEIISGGARGIDALAVAWASFKGAPFRVIEADWNRHGKRAGWLRNLEMAALSTHCIVVWDRLSKGARMMIDIAYEQDIPTVVVTPHSDDRRWE